MSVVYPKNHAAYLRAEQARRLRSRELPLRDFPYRCGKSRRRSRPPYRSKRRRR